MGNSTEKTPKYVTGYSPKDIETRVVKSFLDVLILIEMKKHANLSGYDVTGFVNNKFDGILSPGTVYATLYAMERKGLIRGTQDGRKTTYQLTESGNIIISSMMTSFNAEMTDFVKKFLTI